MKRKSTLRSAFFSRHGLIAPFLCAAACLIVTGTLLAFLRPESPAKVPDPAAAGLTFAERVAHQRAVEEVYWRHRIWPKKRLDRKPSLDAILSQAQLEKKVKDDLRRSQALDDYWQRPITVEQLQAEMDRMAKNTNSPRCCANFLKRSGTTPL